MMDTSVNVVKSKVEGSNVASQRGVVKNRVGIKLSRYVVPAVVAILFILAFRYQIQNATCFTMDLLGVGFGWCK